MTKQMAAIEVVDGSRISKLSPSMAIVIYGQATRPTYHQADPQQWYATVHSIEEKGTKRKLKAGVPIDRIALMQVVQRLSSRSRAQFIPENVLALGADYVAWWIAPAKRPIWFGEGTVLAGRQDMVPQPGMIFVSIGQDIFVAAVKGNLRPEAATQVHMAPYFNVWEQGRVCKGNVPFPKHPTLETIDSTAQAFFDSYSTTPNVQRGLVKYRGGAVKMWRDLLDGRHVIFPDDALVSLKQTVEQFIQHKVETYYARK